MKLIQVKLTLEGPDEMTTEEGFDHTLDLAQAEFDTAIENLNAAIAGVDSRLRIKEA